LLEAFSLPVSTTQRFFDGKAFSDWKKSREIELKTHGAIIERLNGITKGINILAKVMGGRR